MLLLPPPRTLRSASACCRTCGCVALPQEPPSSELGRRLHRQRKRCQRARAVVNLDPKEVVHQDQTGNLGRLVPLFLIDRVEQIKGIPCTISKVVEMAPVVNSSGISSCELAEGNSPNRRNASAMGVVMTMANVMPIEARRLSSRRDSQGAQPRAANADRKPCRQQSPRGTGPTTSAWLPTSSAGRG